MNDGLTTMATMLRFGVIVQAPVRFEPPRRIEYPYQMTLAAPGLMMPFMEPGYAPTLATGLPASCPAERPPA